MLIMALWCEVTNIKMVGNEYKVKPSRTMAGFIFIDKRCLVTSTLFISYFTVNIVLTRRFFYWHPLKNF